MPDITVHVTGHVGRLINCSFIFDRSFHLNAKICWVTTDMLEFSGTRFADHPGILHIWRVFFSQVILAIWLHSAHPFDVHGQFNQTAEYSVRHLVSVEDDQRGPMERPWSWSRTLALLTRCNAFSVWVTPCASTTNWMHVIFHREGVLVAIFPRLRSLSSAVSLPYQRDLAQRHEDSLPCSTGARGPNFAYFHYVDWKHSFIMTLNIIYASAKSTSE